MPKATSTEERHHAQELRDHGNSLKAIANRLGRSVGWVQKHTANPEPSAPEPQAAPPPPPEPNVAQRAIERARNAVVPKPPPTDPRPIAWKRMLLAAAQGEPIPRDCRIHDDERITGRERRNMAQALVKLGNTPEEAAEAVYSLALDQHRGEKHLTNL